MERRQDVAWNVAIALGANEPGCHGAPQASFDFALRELVRVGGKIKALSKTYSTKPFGGSSQLSYLNAVVLLEIALPPAQLLRFLKSLERLAGRRTRVRNGPRPLDMDIIAFRSQRIGWSHGNVSRWRKRRLGEVTIPHPEIVKRAFVLVPLLDVAPNWVHPVLGIGGRRLLSRLGDWRHAVRPV